MTITVKCRSCGSVDIHALDIVIVTSQVLTWKRDEDADKREGNVVVPYNFGAGETHWDSSKPLDDATPYECGHCLTRLGNDDLVIEETT